LRSDPAFQKLCKENSRERHELFQSDDAFRLLDHLLVVPNGLTVPVLKLQLDWDPLRKDPRFQALINKYDTR